MRLTLLWLIFIVPKEFLRIRRARRKRPREDRTPSYRRNRQIRVPKVNLIDHKNDNHGIIDTRDALKMAEEAELDLVEVAPRQRPPVARIMDYSKFIYEQQKKNRDARNRQRKNKIEIKTIKLKPSTADFHRDIQVNKRARKWLIQKKKVKVEIRFRGRAITYPELGRKVMDEVAEELQEVAIVESRARMEGRTMIMMLAPNPNYKPPADLDLSDDEDDDDFDDEDDDDIEGDVEMSADTENDDEESDDSADATDENEDDGVADTPENAVDSIDPPVDSDEQPADSVEQPADEPDSEPVVEEKPKAAPKKSSKAKADSEKADTKPAKKGKKKTPKPAEKSDSDKE